MEISDRKIPQIPSAGARLNMIIDSDVANEIDDLYAIAFALACPERFNIKGITCAHYNNKYPGAGPKSIETSYALAKRLLAAAKASLPLYRGSHPMQYYRHPSESEGAAFIIEEAKKATPQNPLWIVVLGAATTTASALLLEPSIAENIHIVFHSRSEHTWPERSVQFNVKGDIHAARALLESAAPLIWFDTGTHLTIPYAHTKEKLAPLGSLGAFLHGYRDENPWFASDKKGFFDLADFIYLLEPGLCKSEIVNAPMMDEYMFFKFDNPRGKMLRVFDIDCAASWELFFTRISAYQA